MKKSFLLFVALACLTCASVRADDAADPTLEEYKDVPSGLLVPKAAPPTETAADENVVDSMTIEDILKAYREGQYSVVLRYFMPLAKNGHHLAEETLGVMYRKGQGVPPNPEEALMWLTRAAEAGRPAAQHHLAFIYYKGEGVEPDPAKALMWMTVASVTYATKTEKDRAVKDRETLRARLTRRDRGRALDMARDFLARRNEAHLLDQETVQ